MIIKDRKKKRRRKRVSLLGVSILLSILRY
jgi:hypothetical protein